MNEILQVATFAGQIILESGGETYRVEETIWRICKTFGAEQAESFVTPTGIMSSICHEGQIYSLTKRVASRTVDLNKIDKVNDLSRNILSKNLTVKEFKEELIKINQGERYSFIMTLFFSAFGAGSCAALFGGTIKDMFSAFLIGLLIRLITIIGNELRINFFFINVISGALTSVSAIILQKLGIASGIDQTIIGSIMLLVPGLAITNAIRDTIAGDLVSGLTRAAEAFFIAISIAVGTGAGLSIWITFIGGI
ncbi:MAG: threonine/serine exporter family protein [Clostridium sp.]|nr:threonine/serine exporter family protein [Clostridium sp.]